MAKKTKKHLLGVKDFQGSVDITDPCYNRDVWCRKNNVKIAEGNYRCIAWEKDCGNWGMRISRIGIFSEKLDKDEVEQKTLPEELAVIGVDSGTAGFFHEKKDFSGDEWADFCYAKMPLAGQINAWLPDEGFCSSSGYGDGSYPVHARRDGNGEIVALDIRFM